MEAQTTICPYCQTPNPAKNLYCLSCGKPLIQEPAAQPPQPPPPQPAFPQAPASQQAPVQVQSFAPPGYPAQQSGAQMPQQNMPSQGFQPQNPAPQAGYYPPPPPPPPLPMVPGLEKLGARKQEWLRLIDDGAEKAERLQNDFVDAMLSRGIPMVTVEKADFSAGFSKKTFQLVRHPAGSVVVAIEPAGKDLVLSWALYVPQAPKWSMLAILAGVAFVVSFLTSLGSVGNFGFFFVNWVFGTFRWLLDVAILALIAGYVWKGAFWYFFMDSPNEIALDTLQALKLAVQQSLLSAAEKAGVDSSKF
jgi:hypothetical protein